MHSTFKQKLREELDFQDIRVKELAEKINISQRTLEGYLSARSSIPPADIAVKIAQVLNITVEYMITGKNESKTCSQTEKQVNQQIIKGISQLSPEGQKLLEDFLQLLLKFDEKKQTN